VILLGCCCAANAQLGRTSDWWSYGGDAQRTGWEKNEQKFTKEEVSKFQLLWKRKLENGATGVRSLMAPVVVGNLIGSRGFKELAFIAGSSNRLWVIDADLDRMYWQKDFGSSEAKSAACGLTAMPTLSAPVTFRFGAPAPAPTPAAPANPSPAASASPSPGAQSTNPANDALSARPQGGPPRPGGANPSPAPAAPAPAAPSSSEALMRRVFEPKPVYILSSDGTLHRLNVDNGADIQSPLPFLPPNANAHSLNFADNTIYTVTSRGCGDAPSAVWAINMGAPTPKAVSFVSNGPDFVGGGGPVLGNDGTVYVQTGDGDLDPASNRYPNAVLALSAKDLQLKQYFTLPEAVSNKKTDAVTGVGTPVVFAYKGRDLVVTAGRDGRLYLLDSHALGGDDHKTPLYRTPVVSTAGIAGGLSSWETPEGIRYVLAPVWGPLHSDLNAPAENGAIKSGAIVAFKVQEQDGKPNLTLAWVSRDMSSPAPPVIAERVVFALSNGEFERKAKRSGGMVKITERPKGSSHATLYAFDALTGKEMYSTGSQVTAPGTLTGLSIANGRLYFTTTDNTIYAFGKYLETGRQQVSASVRR
jgi:outer membrane protein assembly factor BamB